MKIYDTLTRSKKDFVPLDSNSVKIYACGPTVYNYIHIGNARPICVFDVLRRFFKYMGYNVTYVQNFTDIDDKIINRANDEKCEFSKISEKYISEYKKDAKGLNIMEADFHPKATQHISDIIDMVTNLIENGHAYVLKNGDVYFRVKSCKEYGKLSHQTTDDLISGARIQIDELKENPLDFALWKSAKPGEPYWNSPWGNGRPGWHIECSVMAKKYLGNTIDIHCGGQDLIFPHHENEIAQSECANGEVFVRYWLHNGYININNQKMSKSLGNFFTVREIAEKYGYEPIRYLMICSHYRSPINFSEDIILQCKSALERLYKFRENIEFLIKKSNKNDLEKTDYSEKLNEYKNRFIDAMSDDINSAEALSIIFELVKDFNLKISNNSYNLFELTETLSLFNELTNVLGILYEGDNSDNNSEFAGRINELVEKRNIARKNKDWKLADSIRDELSKMNVSIEDTPDGAKIIFK